MEDTSKQMTDEELIKFIRQYMSEKLYYCKTDELLNTHFNYLIGVIDNRRKWY